jgi:hypothetical protein
MWGLEHENENAAKCMKHEGAKTLAAASVFAGFVLLPQALREPSPLRTPKAHLQDPTAARIEVTQRAGTVIAGRVTGVSIGQAIVEVTA